MELRRSILVRKIQMKSVVKRTFILILGPVLLVAGWPSGLVVCLGPDVHGPVEPADRPTHGDTCDVRCGSGARSRHDTERSCRSCVDAPVGCTTGSSPSWPFTKPAPKRLLATTHAWRSCALPCAQFCQSASARPSPPAHFTHLRTVVLLI